MEGGAQSIKMVKGQVSDVGIDMKAAPYLYFRGPADGPHHICLGYSYKCAIAILRQEGQRAQEQVLAASTTRFVILLRPGATNGVLLSDSKE